ncbi:hypothetical protein BCV69DRAFT_282683 [Microstroma glucosiphilum]|uniref:LIM zinc-binding domain-containing protein n=1 Tax=Pseudomicrostroma glucosiphilum TaxID=1684307 RepID=A0A316U7H3_9BASI|nr:hypothetical protein BCV69DRAFT_282683 [Pseudomicrostroma glucosiphilum]PWN21187.1 hypothetical protein BCV69DRAFT_282683 [Pseudomicrostroma glucosiphilum]
MVLLPRPLQIIGPQARPYHKSCLTCVVCNKRLDSTLLVEHDGQPLCRHCHRDSLGQGKGGFNKAVPLRASLPPSPPKPSQPQRFSQQYAQELRDEDEMARRLTGINIRPREGSTHASGQAAFSPTSGSSSSFSPSAPPPRPENPTPSTALAPMTASQTSGSYSSSSAISPSSLPSAAGDEPPNQDWREVESIDEYIASSAGIPNVVPRSTALRGGADGINRALGASQEQPTSTRSAAEPRPGLTPQHTPTLRSPAYIPSGDESPRRSGSRPLPQPPTHASTSSHPSSVTPAAAAPAITSSATTGGLPPPARRTPVSTSVPSFKTAHGPYSSTAAPSSPFRSQYGNLSSSTSSTPTRLANAVSSGTPLCARCQRPVYHAEQVIAASGARTWHRPCLKCEECGSTLQKGSLEEGPVGNSVHDGSRSGESYGQGCNTFCKVCYRRLFGPRGIGNAGTSFPSAA